MTMFIELNGGSWDPEAPDVDDAERMMLAVAEGSATEADLAAWLAERVDFER
ncbi:MAG: hypothetical protein ACK5PP_20310 [Acidimicrobiales bacterium]